MIPNTTSHGLKTPHTKPTATVQKLSRRALLLGAALTLAGIGQAACGLVSTNILDKTFELGAQKFSLDFGVFAIQRRWTKDAFAVSG